MNSQVRHIKTSLAAKLITAIGLLMVIGGGISWYSLISAAKRNLTNSAIQHAASYSELIKRSTRYGMLTYHRESLQQTMDSIGSAGNVRRARIFNGSGRVFYSSRHEEIGRMVDRGSPACIGCHSDPLKPLMTLKTRDRWTIYRDKDGRRVITFIDPIYNEPSCYTAACHVHAQELKVLGILETDFSLFPVDENIRRQTIEITIYAVVFMGISSIILYFVLLRFVLNPVSTLSTAMKNVSGGDLKQKAVINSGDEMRLLADTFNVMTEDLKTAREKMENWTKTLEDEVAKKTKELKDSQGKLIQAEKLASLGRLTADVAHEIRNPLTALGGFARRLHKISGGGKEKEYAEVVVAEVDRLEKVLKDVLIFSRDVRCRLQRQSIVGVVMDSLKMHGDLCNEQSIKTDVELKEGLPAILMDMEQVRQALENLITNAIDAMPGGGRLLITAGAEELYNVFYVFVKVSDTGPGIPPEKLSLIFEPFFSTKETGHGTGLGLSIARKIIEEHGGFIKAESALGKGSAFSLYFPCQREEESQKVKCWEYMKCGRDKDATIKCPAYPDFGRICWAVAGTFCEGKVQGTFAQKYEDCRKCEFYQRVINKEI